MTRLLLAGAGHAHLVTLERLAKTFNPHLDVTLISPTPWQYYSGMLPGWVAGEYTDDDCRIDVRPVAARARVNFICQKITAINADRNTAQTADGRIHEYDILSLDTGSETESNWYDGAPANLLTAKPLDGFQTGWRKSIEEAREKKRFDLAVVGGGAAGIELAMVGKAALDAATINASVTLVISESGFLPGHADVVKARVEVAIKRAGIAVIRDRATGINGGLSLASGKRLQADRVIAATGARASDWLQSSGLALAEDGFAAVDRYQRSTSHKNVFAVGDVSSRIENPVARSGVHAVRAGPILARNLIAAANGKTLIPYAPRKSSLYILASGRKTAIASWGNWAAEGRWVWLWKDFIDRRFMRRFKNINM